MYKDQPEDLGTSNGVYHDFDFAWAPGSRHAAFRIRNRLLIVDPEHSASQAFGIDQVNADISSFRWVDDNAIVFLTKTTKSAGVNPVVGIDVWLLNLATGKTEHLYNSPATFVTFLGHSAGFSVDEFSPFAPIAAAFDGTNMLFYDYASRCILFKAPIGGAVDGVWWPDANTCLIAVDALLHEAKFFTIGMTDKHVTDVTTRLRPYWTGTYDPLWFKAGFP